jgi:hypothetical protein
MRCGAFNALYLGAAAAPLSPEQIDAFIASAAAAPCINNRNKFFFRLP